MGISPGFGEVLIPFLISIITHHTYQKVEFRNIVGMYIRSQTSLVFFYRPAEKLNDQAIPIRYLIITRLIPLVPDYRQPNIPHRHKAEQVVQEDLFTDYIILGLTQFDTDADNIG